MRGWGLIIGIVFLSLASSVFAAKYHSPEGIVCLDCHGGNRKGVWEERYNLKSDALSLCLNCHGGGSASAPDVLKGEGSSGREMAGGGFAGPGEVNPSGHNIGTTAPPLSPSRFCALCHSGGRFSELSLTCVYCHNPHGNKSYRNLRRISNPDRGPEIRAAVNPKVTGMAAYRREDVRYIAPDSQDSEWREVTNICQDCHHTFSGADYIDPRREGVYVRHPSTDTERGTWSPVGRHGAHTDPSHWIGGKGLGFSIPRLPFLVSGATTFEEAGKVSGRNEVFCLTCHRAHGSDYKNGLNWDYGGGSSEGCQQCHNKG